MARSIFSSIGGWSSFGSENAAAALHLFGNAFDLPALLDSVCYHLTDSLQELIGWKLMIFIGLGID